MIKHVGHNTAAMTRWHQEGRDQAAKYTAFGMDAVGTLYELVVDYRTPGQAGATGIPRWNWALLQDGVVLSFGGEESTAKNAQSRVRRALDTRGRRVCDWYIGKKESE